MKTTKKISVFLLTAAMLTLLPAGPACAQYTETGLVPVYNFTPKAYKALEQNWCATEDNRGLIYVGNNAGILEYDGVHWTLIPPSDGSPVHSIARNDSGRIFFGSVNTFGYLETDSIGNLKYHLLSDLLPEEKRDFHEVWETHVIGEKVFFQSFHQIFTWDHDSLRVFHSDQEIQESFLVEGELFLSFPEAGISCFRDDTLHPVVQGVLPDKALVYEMVPESPGQILIVTEKHGFYRLKFNREDPSSSTIRPVRTGNDRIFRNTEIYNACPAGNGLLSLGTWGDGVILVDSMFNIVRVLNRETGLQDPVIQGQYLDSHGNLWLTLGSGISRVEVSTPVTRFTEAQGIEGIIQAVVRFNNSIYAASNTGLYYLDKSVHSTVTAPVFRQVPGFDIEVWDLLTFRLNDEELLLLITNEKVFGIRPDHTYTTILEDYAYTLCQSVRDPHRVFIGLESGITSIYRSGKHWQVEPAIEDITELIKDICETSTGDIWLGTLDEGILRVRNAFNPKNDKPQVDRFGSDEGLPGGPFLVEQIGTGIIAATNEGLFRLSPDGARFEPDTVLGREWGEDAVYIHRISAKSDSLVYMVTFDEGAEVQYEVGFMEQSVAGYQWVSEPFRGISEELNHAIFEDEGRVVWMGGSHGLFRYEPGKRRSPVPFCAHISQVEVSETRTLFGGAFAGPRGLPVAKQPGDLREILSYRENSPTFLFGAYTGQNEEFTQYSFMLEGYDKKWSEWSPETKKEYTNLHEGKYRFRLKARTLYEHESSEAVYGFSILAPWYRKWWAYVMYVVLAAVVVYLIVIAYTKQLRQIIRERTAEVVAQKEVIEEKNKDIMDSVQYAEKIQRAILPPADDLERLNLDGFILFLPRDFVSGDFYWLAEKNGKIITVAADCTGHGVPGAFMSMLGVAFLNNIVGAQGIVGAAEILNQLRSEVIHALKQKGQEGEQKDGMDLALHVIDREKMTLEFAGANNPLILIRDNEIIQVKADRMPIGIHERADEPFTSHHVNLQKGDVFYTFSDGYQDQFGGPKNKKFMIKRLKELFLEIHQKPMDEQKTILHHTFIDWISYETEQIDDVIVIGVRV